MCRSPASMRRKGDRCTASDGPVTITVTATDGGVTKTNSRGRRGCHQPRRINWIDISSSSTSFPPGFQTQRLRHGARDAGRHDHPRRRSPSRRTTRQSSPSPTVQNTGHHHGRVGAGDRHRRIQGHGDPRRRRDRRIVHVRTRSTIDQPAPRAGRPSTPTNDDFGDPTAATGIANPNDLLIRPSAVRAVVQRVARHAELGVLRARRAPDGHRRRPLQLLHGRSAAPGEQRRSSRRTTPAAATIAAT